MGKILGEKSQLRTWPSRTLGQPTAISASGWLLGSVGILLLLLVCLKAGVEFFDNFEGSLLAGEQQSVVKNLKWVWNCVGLFCSVFFGGDFLFCPFSLHLQHFEPGSCYFPGICSIFDFEPFFIHSFCIIFMESAHFWRWKLSFQRFCGTVPSNLQHFAV